MAENDYPWKFAFIAYTTGEYKLGVRGGSSQVIAHLTVTCYDDD
jgi:hypothetical protein